MVAVPRLLRLGGAGLGGARQGKGTSVHGGGSAFVRAWPGAAWQGEARRGGAGQGETD
jgi:hypothetical protein